MDSEALKQIQNRIAELPPNVRAAVESADLAPKVRAIGTRHQLHIDQTGELEDEVMLAMLGFSPLDTLAARLTQTLRVSQADGEKIASEVSSEIFGPIRESLRAFTSGANKPQQAAASTPVPPSAPAKPPVSPDIHAANVVLTQPTVSLPVQSKPAQAPAQGATAPKASDPIYKSDPYREPI